MDPFLHFSLFIAHAGLTAFNVVGWIWRATRRIHLYTCGATIVSWFGLGLIYGMGYCPLTDWQWTVKRRLGETALPGSWMKYYLDKWTDMVWDPGVVDSLVLFLGVTALGLSIVLNYRDIRRGRPG